MLRIAQTHGNDPDSLLPGLLRRFDWETALQIITVGNQNQVLVLFDLLVKNLVGGLANRITDIGPAAGRAFGCDIFKSQP